MVRKAISPWFLFRRVIASAQDGGADQDVELDFEIGQGQGVEISASWLGIAEVVVTGAGPSALESANISIELHRRTGTLTDETTPGADSEFTQSETLQEIRHNIIALDEAAGAGGVTEIETGQPVINWRDLLNEPLLIAANLTLRAAPGGASTVVNTWNGIYAKLLYRYVQVTAADLVKAFIARQ